MFNNKLFLGRFAFHDIAEDGPQQGCSLRKDGSRSLQETASIPRYRALARIADLLERPRHPMDLAVPAATPLPVILPVAQKSLVIRAV